MVTPMLVLTATLLALPAPDTVLAVERGTRLDVENGRGQVAVRVWDRDAVRVRTQDGAAPALSRSGSVVRVRPEERRGVPSEADFQIAVPRWMDVRIRGRHVDVDVRGTEAAVSVETIGGDVRVDGGAGDIAVRTVQGGVVVRNARGRVEVVAVNDDVRLETVAGDIRVETTNGAITMEGIRSGSAQARSVNGSVTYAGPIRDDGRYTFSTHNGAITLVISEASNATVSAGTYNGGFESDFPVQLTGTSRDRHYHFTLGSGSARVELESFNGNLRLRRPR